MMTNLHKLVPSQLSAAALVVGFGLALTDHLALKAAGAGLILLAFFVPFLRLAAPRAADEEPPPARPPDAVSDRVKGGRTLRRVAEQNTPRTVIAHARIGQLERRQEEAEQRLRMLEGEAVRALEQAAAPSPASEASAKLEPIKTGTELEPIKAGPVDTEWRDSARTR